jgi:hypothetical protein
MGTLCVVSGRSVALDIKLARIRECAAEANRDTLSRNLLHAYTACLTFEELCESAIKTLDSPLDVRRSILNGLLRAGREGGSEEHLDELGARLLGLSPPNPKTRVHIDALLSQLYRLFLPPTRQIVLERWRTRGTIGAAARWLKAISDDGLMFDISQVLAYWRVTRDYRAAKLLAYRGDPPLLANLLPEIIEGCDEGWIVSRATLNAGAVSEACWEAIRGKFPATYAYLCAKVGRRLGHAEALDLVRQAGTSGATDNSGLVIWAIGQLGMWSTLEQIRAMLPELHNETLMRLGLSPQPR